MSARWNNGDRFVFVATYTDPPWDACTRAQTQPASVADAIRAALSVPDAIRRALDIRVSPRQSQIELHAALARAEALEALADAAERVQTMGRMSTQVDWNVFRAALARVRGEK